VAPSGRATGKININTIWDSQALPYTFLALCDPNTSNHVNNQTTVTNIWNAFMAGTATVHSNSTFGRTPYPNATTPQPALPQDIDVTAVGTANIPSYYLTGGIQGGTTPYKYDRPVLGLATGTTTGASGTQFPNNRGIDDTLLRSFNNQTNIGRVFQSQADFGTTTHPYLQYQLLSKIFNNVTTRSNCFAIWLTVGFFQVTDDTTTPPTLGPEIGISEGRNVRHRMFAIVDRTNLAAFQSTSKGAISLTNPGAGINPQDGTANAPINVDANGGQAYNQVSDISTVVNTTDTRNGNTITFAAGMSFVFEPGTDNEETVVTYATGAAGAGPFGAEFHKAHVTGVPVIIRGNPGPWKRYDPRQDPNVVIHWTIIK
jgi:hypothetical protein